jgi:23S rRNA pseudouridine2605 synthase
MRLNKFLAVNAGLSRRNADNAIKLGQVKVNGQLPSIGIDICDDDKVSINGHLIHVSQKTLLTIALHKPVGYVCSKDGQGSPTVYDLLPPKYHHLNIAGRLDKDSSGLLILTNDGDLLNQLTHPKFNKNKIYYVTLNKPLSPSDQQTIQKGVMLQDGLSKLSLKLWRRDGKGWQVTMQEGRNRQIRRTFNSLGYKVIDLHRTSVGPYNLNTLKSAEFKLI